MGILRIIPIGLGIHTNGTAFDLIDTICLVSFPQGHPTYQHYHKALRK
jgi:hypothetical protein